MFDFASWSPGSCMFQFGKFVSFYRQIQKFFATIISNTDSQKYSCSSAISTLAGKENKRRLQTLSIDNAWSNKNFLVYLTFRMLQHTSSEVNGYNCYKHLKIQKIKRGTGDKMTKIDTTDS